MKIRGIRVEPTPAFDAYWYFAAERLKMYYRRMRGGPGAAWTEDYILETHRFTNTFRAADRVSQYLIRELYTGEQTPTNILFRVVMFRFFNRIETWEALKAAVGMIDVDSYNFAAYNAALTEMKESGKSVYTGAYMLNCPDYGERYKHGNHLRVVEQAVESFQDGIHEEDEAEMYAFLHSVPHIGDFLAYQMLTDLGYSSAFDFEENAFTFAGPGAKSGIRKMFGKLPEGLTDADVIHWLVRKQGKFFEQYGWEFAGLFGRPLQAIDAQNCLCETDKYCRASLPDIDGLFGRNKIKQGYRRPSEPYLARPWFPPKWNINQEVVRWLSTPV